MPKFVSKKSRWGHKRSSSTKYVNWYCLVSLAIFFIMYMILVPMEVDISGALLKLHKAELQLSEALIKQKLAICSEARLKISPAARALCWLDQHQDQVEFGVNNLYYYTCFVSGMLILCTVNYGLHLLNRIMQNHHVYDSLFLLGKYCVIKSLSQLKHMYAVIFFDYDIINKKIKVAEKDKMKFEAQRRKWIKQRKEAKYKQIIALRKNCHILCEFSAAKKEVSQMQVLLEEMSIERGEILEKLENTEKEFDAVKTINEDSVRELHITLGVNVMLKAKVFALQNEKIALEESLKLLEKQLGSSKAKAKSAERRAWDMWKTGSRCTVQEVVTTKNGRRLGKTGSQTAEVGSDSNFSLYQNESCQTYVGKYQPTSIDTDDAAEHSAVEVQSGTTSVNCASQSASNWSDETEEVIVFGEAESVQHCPELCEQSDCSLCAEFHYNRFPEHCGKNFECFEYRLPHLDQSVFKETQFINCGHNQYPLCSNFVRSEFTTLRHSHKGACHDFECPSHSNLHCDSTKPEPPSDYECCEFGHRLQSRSMNTSDLVQVTEFNYSHKTVTSEDMTADEMEPNVVHDEQINLKKYMTASKPGWNHYPRNIHQKNLLFLRHLLRGNRGYISSSFTSDTGLTPLEAKCSEDSDQGSLRPVTDSAAFRHFLRGLDHDVRARPSDVRRTSESSLMSASAKRRLSRPDSSTTTRSLSPVSGVTSLSVRCTHHKRPRTATNKEKGPFQRYWRR